jgi:hypothetical protein
MFVSEFIVLLADSILQQMEKGIDGRVRIKDAQPLCFWIDFVWHHRIGLSVCSDETPSHCE